MSTTWDLPPIRTFTLPDGRVFRLFDTDKNRALVEHLRTRTPPPEWPTAIHESAHAIVCREVGGHIYDVELCAPDAEYAGTFLPVDGAEVDTPAVLMASQVALRDGLGLPDAEVLRRTKHDRRLLREYCEREGRPLASVHAVAESRARRILARRWRWVEAVATELIRRRRLTGAQIEEVLRR